ncbi:MAG TPA: hypothetical protein VJ894_06955 [Cryomorphaceae bacterium]|nr:hypothetical protein [Cryomorphaceae bacterium]
MTPTSADIYKSILYRAADIYDVDYSDVERDIGQRFDPIVRFMSGAMASELEKVYHELSATELRLQNRLAKVLLPEYYHLPQAAHALATATSQSGSVMLKETTAFSTESVDKEFNNIAFSPIFPGRILPGKVSVIATDDTVILSGKKTRARRQAKRDISNVSGIIIGIESKEPITNWQGASLFFNLTGTDAENADKAIFYGAIARGRCAYHGRELFLRQGLPQEELHLEDQLNGNERRQSRIRARYERHFLTFADSDIPPVEPIVAEERLKSWFTQQGLDESETEKLIVKLEDHAEKPMFWIEIYLSQPVDINNVLERLRVRLNVFPVVNRRLNGNEKGGHHYLKDNSIKWVALKPEEDFLSIRRVFEEKPPEYPDFKYKPFAEFREERIPTYTLRFGGVGRWDEYNAWERLAYIVRVLSENNKQEEIIEAAAKSLSLEEIHQMLGKKISKEAADEKPTKDIYVLLHSGVKFSLRVRVEYWTSIGSQANDIPAKTKLNCFSTEKSSFAKGTLELITTTAEGREPLNSIEQLNALKSTLLSRGRIVTREDVKGFCRSMLNEKLQSVEVKDSVGIDPRFNFGMTRNLKVLLTPSKQGKNADWDGICVQIQKLLEENSTASIPIIVELNSKVLN